MQPSVMMLLVVLPVILFAGGRADDRPTWVVGKMNDRRNCTPVVASNRLHAAKDSPLALLRVHVVFTPGVASLAGHLIETLIATLPSQVSSLVDGICIGLHDVSGGGQGEQLSPTPAPFGSPEYYAVLMAKHKAFTDIIQGYAPDDATTTFTPRFVEMPSVAAVEARCLSWALFLDADTQVFSGWLEHISKLISNTSILAHCDANFGPGCDRLRSSVAGKKNQAEVGVFFQRESRKLINSGVALVNLANPAVRCLYRSALLSYRPSQYGDQTSLQRVLAAVARRGGWCNLSSRPGDGGQLHHYVFHRLRVNAAILAPSLLVIQHAHMSGRYKADHLLRSSRTMNVSASGRFLESPNVPVDEIKCDGVESACSLAKNLLLGSERPVRSFGSLGSSRRSTANEAPVNGSWRIAFVINGSLAPDVVGMRGASMVRADDQAGFWWTVVPALIVLGTLAFYHCFVDKS